MYLSVYSVVVDLPVVVDLSIVVELSMVVDLSVMVPSLSSSGQPMYDNSSTKLMITFLATWGLLCNCWCWIC